MCGGLGGGHEHGAAPGQLNLAARWKEGTARLGGKLVCGGLLDAGRDKCPARGGATDLAMPPARGGWACGAAAWQPAGRRSLLLCQAATAQAAAHVDARLLLELAPLLQGGQECMERGASGQGADEGYDRRKNKEHACGPWMEGAGGARCPEGSTHCCRGVWLRARPAHLQRQLVERRLSVLSAALPLRLGKAVQAVVWVAHQRQHRLCRQDQWKARAGQGGGLQVTSGANRQPKNGEARRWHPHPQTGRLACSTARHSAGQRRAGRPAEPPMQTQTQRQARWLLRGAPGSSGAHPAGCSAGPLGSRCRRGRRCAPGHAAAPGRCPAGQPAVQGGRAGGWVGVAIGRWGQGPANNSGRREAVAKQPLPLLPTHAASQQAQRTPVQHSMPMSAEQAVQQRPSSIEATAAQARPAGRTPGRQALLPLHPRCSPAPCRPSPPHHNPRCSRRHTGRSRRRLQCQARGAGRARRWSAEARRPRRGLRGRQSCWVGNGGEWVVVVGW